MFIIIYILAKAQKITFLSFLSFYNPGTTNDKTIARSDPAIKSITTDDNMLIKLTWNTVDIDGKKLHTKVDI